ncbi:MAG: hypothetical protein ACRDRH_21020 [Pseudonocardia sp.]
MLGDIADRVHAILTERTRQLPRIRADIGWWLVLDEQLGDLAVGVDELRRHPTTPDELRVGLAAFRVEELREGIAEAVALLRVLESRFSRSTIDIGVSGQARVGKSTLLQAMSGLGDEQIPTGQALPVTAVRSRIHHSPDHHRATVALHSFKTFVAEIIAAYHAELGLPGLPATPSEFRTWAYPSGGRDADTVEGRADRPSYVTMLNRLRAMQASFPTYERDLTGEERIVELAELRPFVAYPTNAQEQAPDPIRRQYLAVRDVRIECPFPHVQVERLGIVDLPGLGEVAVRADQHHVNGLQNEVDVVLLVKRPVEGMAYWGEADARALDLIDSARGFVGKRDFVFLVINRGATPAPLVTALRDHIRGQVNSGLADQFFRVLETDAADPADVAARVLDPVLTHLADRLPIMDADVLAGTRAEFRAVASRIGVAVEDLGTALSAVPGSTGTTAEDLDLRARRLRQDLAGALVGLVTELRQQARNAVEDSGYVAAVDAAYHKTREWINSGLGVGQQAWQEDGLRVMRVDKGGGGYAGDELNRVRVEISNCFEGIDDFFSVRINALWRQVGEILASNLGTLLDGSDGEAAIRRFADLLDGASQPCPRLSGAVRALLGIRLEYRSQLHPRVRAELDGLALELPNPRTGELETQITVSVDEAGVETLYHHIIRAAEQAAHRTRKALLLMEGVTPALVLHAAAEQFEDTLIRSGDSEREFARLARSYRDEIWSGVFGEIDAANARVARVVRARAAVLASLAATPWRQA